MIRNKIAILLAASLMASTVQPINATVAEASENIVEKIFVCPPAIVASGLNACCTAFVLDAAFLASAIFGGYYLREAIQARQEGKSKKKLLKKRPLHFRMFGRPLWFICDARQQKIIQFFSKNSFLMANCLNIASNQLGLNRE